jgi:hypothetical protein
VRERADVHLVDHRALAKDAMPLVVGPLKRGTPLILGVMAQLMMRPSSEMIRRFNVPDEVIREAYTDNPGHAERTREALRKVRRLSDEIGIVNPVTRRIWKALGIWAD